MGMKNINDAWPKSYKCKFIEPGLVHYAEFGTVLVQKPALDSMAQSFVGKPVIDEAHKEVHPSIYSQGEADGVVTKVWYDNSDGWYWAEYLVWNPVTQRHCESGAYSVSCAYSAKEYNTDGGKHNSLNYDQEILSGVYDHLAIVTNPRYEGARIIYNSKGGNAVFKFFKNKDEKKAEEIDLENAVVEIDGKDVKLKDLIKAHNDSTVVAGSSMSKIGLESLIEVDGKQVPIKDMVSAYQNKLKNDEDDKKKKDEADRKNAEEKEKKDKEEADRKNAEEKEKKEKEDMKNAHDTGKHIEAIQNCVSCSSPEGKAHFEKLKNSAGLRGEPQTPERVDRHQKLATGAERYGSPKPK